MSTTSDRLLVIARDILLTDGADAVSMRRVAAAAGVTPMAIYRHYENREALLQAVADAAFAEIGKRWAQRPAARELGQRVTELLDDHLDFALGQPKLYDFVFTDARETARQWPDDFRARRSPSLTLVADAMRAGMASGDLREDDEWELALMFATMLHGLVRLYHGERISLSEEDFRALAHKLVGRMLDGFRA